MRSSLLPIIFLLHLASLSAQLPSPCAAGFTPAVTCETACVFCNFDGYEGSTVGFPAVQVPKFCGTGTIENVQWLGFIAGAAEATFTIQPLACFNGDGVQVALYEHCDAAPIACNMGKAKNDLSPVSVTATLTPGRTYYLLIDGFAGDQCDFVIDVAPRSAVYEPALGVPGPIAGPPSVCPGGSGTFSIDPVPGAGAYIWTGPPGAMMDTLPLPVILPAPAGEKIRITFGSEVGPVCVSAANACRQNPPCASTLSVSPPQEHYRPRIEGDSTGYLSCDGTPAALQFRVEPPGNYRYRWQTDSTGRILGDSTALQLRADKQGVYVLRAENTDNGCAVEKQLRLLPPDFPAGADILLKNALCNGDKNGSVEVAAVRGGRSPLMFSFDGRPFSEVKKYDFLGAGTYSLRIETADGCTWDTLVRIWQPALLELKLGADTSIGLGEAFLLWDSSKISEPRRAVQLDIAPDTLKTFLQNDQWQPLHSFIYTLIVRDSNGCTAADSRAVRVEKHRRLYLPNVFSPASLRGGNERLLPHTGDDVVSIEQFLVFDRWGNLLHEARHKAPLDPALGWNGMIGGRQAAPGVYVCRVEALFLDGAKEVFTQDVLLLR